MSKSESIETEIKLTNPNQLSKVFGTIEGNNKTIHISIKNCDLSEEQITSLTKKLAKYSDNGIKITLDYNKKLEEVLNKLVIGFISNLKILSFNINAQTLSDEAIGSLNNHILNSNCLNSFIFICKLDDNQAVDMTKALKENFSMLGKQLVNSRSHELPTFTGFAGRNKKALIKVKEFIEAVIKEDKPLPSGTEYEKIYELYQRVNQTQLRELLLKSDTSKFKIIAEIDNIFSTINNHINSEFWKLKGINKSGDFTPEIVLEEGQLFKGIIALKIAEQLNRITGGKNLTAINYEHEHTHGCKLSGDNTDDQSI